MSHLEEVSDEGIQAMADASVIAVLLPTTAYILRLKCPPARKLIDKGTGTLSCPFSLSLSTGIYIKIFV